MSYRTLSQLILWLFLVCFSSCVTISYTPSVRLDLSPKTIQKIVQIDKFLDSTAIKSHKNGYGKFAITNKKSFTGELDLEITKAIIFDFSTNAVFKEAGRKVDNPDYYLKGIIRKFKGHVTTNGYTKASTILLYPSAIAGAFSPILYLGVVPYFTLLLGVPAEKTKAEVEIEIQIYDRNNKMVGKYKAKAEKHFSSSIYKNARFGLPNVTNKVLTEVVAKLREQIISDVASLEGR